MRETAKISTIFSAGLWAFKIQVKTGTDLHLKFSQNEFKELILTLSFKKTSLKTPTYPSYCSRIQLMTITMYRTIHSHLPRLLKNRKSISAMWEKCLISNNNNNSSNNNNSRISRDSKISLLDHKNNNSNNSNS